MMTQYKNELKEVKKGRNDKIHQLTIEIINNIEVNSSSVNYSKSYNAVYNLLTEKCKKEFSAVSYGC